MIGLEHYLILSGILFCIGFIGVISKRNAVVILMCIEIMLNAVNIALVAFSRYIVPAALTGQVFAIFVIAVAAAEAAVGIAKKFITLAIETNPGLGKGSGPVNHHAEIEEQE